MLISGAVSRSAYRLYQLAWTGLDWLYPPECGGCGKEGVRWCEDCQQMVYKLDGPICEICGRSISREANCPDCSSNRPPYSKLRSWAIYDGPVRQAILRLKYDGDIGLGEALAFFLIGFFQELAWPVELICPTPIGRTRLRKRGYNQAALLSLPLALSVNLPYAPRALSKARDTATQVGLNHDQRFANVAGAFWADRRIVEGKVVLVVDDVTTTGATMLDCTRALLQAGAREVYGLTLARAGLAQHSIEENGRAVELPSPYQPGGRI